jgi:hypothetical protein
VKCTTCADTRWVCENHPDKPWTKEWCECGSGTPCPRCNTSDPPDFSGVITTVYDRMAGDTDRLTSTMETLSETATSRP